MTKTANSGPVEATSKRTAKENDTRTSASVKKEGDKEERGQAAADQPKLLSGGNPQIAKGYGDAPVQAYIAAMPGWKSAVGRRLDQLAMRAAPKAQKAVKWNSPLYGMEGNGWFLGVHCFAKYIKVAFFNGAFLSPPPPVESKMANARYFHIHEKDEIDEAQISDWVKQASQLPGERM